MTATKTLTPVRAGFDRRYTVEVVDLFAKPAPTTPGSCLLTTDN
ncbi:hypothetical protein [Chroococcidiopsis sp. SAG 2025]|nr:hypothetical protein [Chroococcidiopsis sp. SAG 2025]